MSLLLALLLSGFDPAVAPSAVYILDGGVTVQNGKSNPVMVSCPDGTCSGGGGGSSSVVSIDSGTVDARVINFPANLLADGGVVNVGNFPSMWPNLQWVGIDGGTTAAVTNFPANLLTDGGVVNVGNFPASQAVTGTFWPGNLLADGGVVNVGNFPATQAVSGTVAVTGTFNSSEQSATGTLGALNAAVTISSMGGLNSVGFVIGGSPGLLGTLVAEYTYDGSTWTTAGLVDNASLSYQSSIVGAPISTSYKTLVIPAGAAGARVRVSVYTSGSATALIRSNQLSSEWALMAAVVAKGNAGAAPVALQTAGFDIGTNTPLVPSVKPASTAAVAADQPMAVALHPSSPLPVGTNMLGSVALDGGFALQQGVDPMGTSHTILTDTLGVQYVTSQPRSLVPPCTKLRKVYCQ